MVLRGVVAVTVAVAVAVTVAVAVAVAVEVGVVVVFVLGQAAIAVALHRIPFWSGALAQPSLASAGALIRVTLAKSGLRGFWVLGLGA